MRFPSKVLTSVVGCLLFVGLEVLAAGRLAAGRLTAAAGRFAGLTWSGKPKQLTQQDTKTTFFTLFLSRLFSFCFTSTRFAQKNGRCPKKRTRKNCGVWDHVKCFSRLMAWTSPKLSSKNTGPFRIDGKSMNIFWTPTRIAANWQSLSPWRPPNNSLWFWQLQL